MLRPLALSARAMAFPQEKIAAIRDRIDIEQVVGRSVRLSRRGGRLWGLCPFHSEKSASFTVDIQKRLFHCFGCQAGGDIFEFVMRIEGLDFREAITNLAREAGVELEDREEDPREREARERRQRLYALNALVAELYAKNLAAQPRALAYLREERGLSAETIERFGLGFAPAEWTHLTQQLEKRRVDLRSAAELGLLGVRPRDGSHYDKLRGRIVFPIVIPSGDVAGFGGRRADWLEGQAEAPKYLNSSESPIYDKSSILYGLRQAKDEIRRGKTAVLVEGYVDVIGVHQAGLPIAVAGCGTALSLRHAGMLARLADEVVTLYDGDGAGQEASRKAAEVLLREGLKVRIAQLPAEDDPDTFARREGETGLRRLIDEAPSAVDFFVQRAKSAYKGGGIAGMAEAVETVKPLLVAIPDPLERDICIDATARQLGIEVNVLRRHLSRKMGDGQAILPGGRPSGAPAERAANPANSDPRRPTPGRAVPARPPAALPIVEMVLLKRLLEEPDKVWAALEASDAAGAFSHPGIQQAVDAARRARDAGAPFDAPSALESARESGSLDDQAAAILRKTLMDELPVPDPLEACVRRLLRNRNDITLRHLRRRLAEETDIEAIALLMKEADRLNRQQASLG